MPMPTRTSFGKRFCLWMTVAGWTAFMLHASTHAGFISEVAPWGRSAYLNRWQPEQKVDLPSYLRVSDLQGLANPQLVIVDARPTNRKILNVISLATDHGGATRLVTSPSTDSLPIELNPLGNSVELTSPLDRWLLSSGKLQKRHLLLFDAPTHYKIGSTYTATAAGSARLLDSITLGTGAAPLKDEFTTAMASDHVLSRLDAAAAPATLNETLHQESVVSSPYVLGLPDATGLIRDTDPNYLLPYWWEPASWNALTVPVVIPEPASWMIGLSLLTGGLAKGRKKN